MIPAAVVHPSIDRANQTHETTCISKYKPRRTNNRLRGRTRRHLKLPCVFESENRVCPMKQMHPPYCCCRGAEAKHGRTGRVRLCCVAVASVREGSIEINQDSHRPRLLQRAGRRRIRECSRRASYRCIQDYCTAVGPVTMSLVVPAGGKPSTRPVPAL